ncbi:hypothetical protein ABK040_011293 [Willaertia magna]
MNHNLFLELNKCETNKLESLQNEKQLFMEKYNNLNKLLQFNNLNNIDIFQYKIKIEKELNNLNNLNEMNNLNIENNKSTIIYVINTKLGKFTVKKINNDNLLFDNKTNFIVKPLQNNLIKDKNPLQNNNFNLIKIN